MVHPIPDMNFCSKTKEEIIYENSSFSNKFGINPAEKGKS